MVTLTPQMEASLALARWQELKRRYPDPGERLDMLMRDFFAPPLISDAEYEADLRKVAEEMSQ